MIWDKDPGRVQMAKTIADAMKNALAPDGTELVMDYGTGAPVTLRWGSLLM